MVNRFIVSPFFLNQSLPELTRPAKPDWVINTPDLSGDGSQEHMSVIYRSLARFVEETAGKGERPVSIAGDCCTAIGLLAGLQHALINPTLIWFDAHGDFNTWETTPSGFLGGMPLAMLVGRGEQTMPSAVGLKALREDRVILTDGRDLDSGERESVMGSDLIYLADVAALLDYPLPQGPLYVHFDADILNPDEAPAQNYSAKGGPSSMVLKAVFRRLAQSGQVVAVSLSSWNPKLDKDGKSQKIGLSLLETLINTG